METVPSLFRSIRLVAAASGTALALSMGLATNAQAFAINGTEVGSLDKLRCAIDSANSGQSYEEAQLQLCVGQTVSLVQNININDGGLLSQGEFNAIGVSPGPGFFVLKFGTGNSGNDMFFFENLVDFNFLVWSDSQLTNAGLPSNHVQSISHYTYGGEGGTGQQEVPEPGSLALAGLALLGAYALRRRKI